MSRVKGDSAKIGNIYNKYLDPWFRKVFKNDEQREVSELFKKLVALDSYMSGAIHELGNLITSGAKDAMDLVDDAKYQEANQFMKNERKKLGPKRRDINKTLGNLYELQSDFIEKYRSLGREP